MLKLLESKIEIHVICENAKKFEKVSLKRASMITHVVNPFSII